MFLHKWRNIISILSKNKFFLIIIFIGIFLRFYRLEEFAQFLGDQGRDAIIIKRIITFEHFPAIGAPTSVGQVYLGPFYYYFIAPWLLFFNFNPVGLAFGVAFFSSLYLLLNYLIVKELINKQIAIISTILITFSYTLIEFSRFSWNPNLLPLFGFLTAYFFIKSLKTKNRWYYFLTGAFLSFSIQLHYLALFLIPPISIIYLFQLIQRKKTLITQFLNSLITFFSFCFFSLPLLIFDLRHQFLNSKNFLKLFTEIKPVASNKITNLIDAFSYLNLYIFNSQFNKFLLSVLLIVIFLSLIILIKKNSSIKIFLIFFLFLLLGISLYGGPKHSHYFAVIYPFYFILIAYFLSFFLHSIIGYFILSFFIIGFLILNYQKYYFLFQKPNNQILHSQKVANFLAEKIANQPYNIATWPVEFTEDNYLYFLELKELRPANRQKIEITNQMFVLCQKEPCQIINSPSWNISMFGKAKIDKIWKYEGLKIYKLIHQK